MRRNLLIVGLGLVSYFRPSPAVGQDIHDTVSQGNVAAVKALLSSDTLLVQARDQRGRTPLHVAAGLDNLEILRVILAAGPDIDAFAGDGSTALQLAVLGGRREIVESLLEHGADANLRNERTGFSATDLAFQEESRHRSQLTRVLLASGGKLDVSRPMDRRMNALDFAVEFGNPDMVRLVVEAGADANTTLFPAAPLSMAALNGYTEIVKILVSAGADVNTADRMGGVPIRWAIERGHVETARVLVANGADVGYAEAANGRGLLHLATLAGQPDLVALLLEYGLSPNATDRSGRTALDYATRYGHKTVADLLLVHDAVHGEAPVERFGISPELTREMGDGEAVAWYLNHRGWAVRTRDHTLVFDAEEFGVTRPHEPSLANGFITAAGLATHPVIAVFTNYHGETGELAYVHHLEDSLPAIRYVHNGEERFRGSARTTYALPGSDTVVEGVQIRAVEVQQDFSSLGYLIHVDGLRIYYASYPVENRESFAKALGGLAESTDRVDLAFLPIVEPDKIDAEFETVLSKLNPRAVLLLDPRRRENLFPLVAERLRVSGFPSPVFAAENPGDAFTFRRP